MLRKEFHIFLTTLAFYTRIPIPANIEFANEMLKKTSRYFPLIGMIVGGIGAAIFLLFYTILPSSIAIIISIITTILVTGAFHEDGFADFCDGFGQGSSPENILEIMKDSHIGSYGIAGLILMLLTKFISLSLIHSIEIPLILISAHALSRLMPVCMIFTTTYVRKDKQSKTKHIGQKGSAISFCVAIFMGTISLIFIPWKASVIIIPLLLILFVLFRWWSIRKIGGYRGDVLGALQQLAEITIYLGFIVYKQNLF